MVDTFDQSLINRYIAAGSPYTPEITLMILSNDKNPKIRQRLAENPNSPLNILNKLLCDDCTEVRKALVDNPSVPAHMLELLVRDPSPDVRYALAECPALPERILLSLLRDENPYVANRATRTYQSLHPYETEVFPFPVCEFALALDDLDSRPC